MTFQGQLEIDPDRGVVYFHSNTGATFLRIQGLPTPVPRPTPGDGLDINISDEQVDTGGGVRTLQVVRTNWR